MTAKISFTTYRHVTSNGDYEHFGIRLFEGDLSVDGYGGSREFLTLEWQRNLDADSDNREWYGMHAENRFDSLYKMELAVRTMRRLTGRGNDEVSFWCMSPETLVSRLRKSKAVEVVYDNRDGRYITLDQVLPKEFRAWRDCHNDHCIVGCLARDEEEARRLIASKLADMTSSNELYDWLGAGRPVRELTSSYFIYSQPDTRSAEEKMSL